MARATLEMGRRRNRRVADRCGGAGDRGQPAEELEEQARRKKRRWCGGEGKERREDAVRERRVRSAGRWRSMARGEKRVARAG